MARPKRKAKTLSTSHSSETSFFRLFDLPLETRLRIYRACFEPPYPASESLDLGFGCDYKISHQSPLLVCRQIHAEIWPIYAEYHVFVFSRPLDFGNHFLSLLPPQRLSAIKHVIWVQSNDPARLESQNFERLWWHYLDFFVALDTFAIEHRGDRDRTYTPGIYQMWSISEQARSFSRCIPLLVGLLQQGGTKKPKGVTKEPRIRYKNRRKLRTTDVALPESSTWLLQAAIMRRAPITLFRDGRRYADRLKVVVRHLPARSDDSLINACGHADMFSSWQNMRLVLSNPEDSQTLPTADFSLCNLWVSTEVGSVIAGRRSCVIRATNSYDMRGRMPAATYFELDPHTRVIEDNDRTPDGAVDVIKIAGEWIRHD